ncbi:tubulin binding cofactor C-domain-containing protein [Ochromonadaceae sp. CCMP2298]|nr:tubulin binding cofactor C-domain-containing protein [Ochromonadaceae sp. CCMP2298]
MPPIVKTFKAPDGKEFNTKSEWRDYMMTEYYSFKNKVNESLIKLPGTIDGQGFDIADCENSTLVVLDHSEQVQVDALKNCKVWISACSSSIFIRECENCTFYTCCRQLRLRDVKNCVFYIFSQAEVHIEFSTGLQFAPFNGSYPEHLAHIKAANLDLTHNMWYDVYDHNDPGKTRANWSLLPDSLYEPLWFPSTPCDLAVPRTAAGGVPKPVQEGENMQSFSLQQMMADAQAPPAAPTPTVTAPTAPTETLEQAAAGAVTPKKSAPSLPPSPPRVPKSDTPAVATPLTTSTGAGASDEDQVKVVLKLFVGCKAGEDISVSNAAAFCCCCCSCCACLYTLPLYLNPSSLPPLFRPLLSHLLVSAPFLFHPPSQ